MGDLPACWMGPGARGHPALEAYFHQLMICRMKLDLVQTVPVAIESFQFWRALVGAGRRGAGLRGRGGWGRARGGAAA